MLLLALPALFLSTPALAGEGEATTPAPRRLVRLEVLGSQTETDALRASLSELFGRIAVELEPASAPSAAAKVDATDAGVVAQVDLREPGVAVVRLARTNGALGEPRSVPQRESRAVLLEETALVIYAGSESLLNEPVGPPPLPPPLAAPEPTAPKPPPPSSAKPPAPAAFDRGPPSKPEARASTPWILEGAMLVSSRAFAQNASLVTGFDLGLHGHVGESQWIPGAWVLGEFHFPFSRSRQGVELSTSVWSVRVEPSVELLARGAFRLELAAGGGADIFVLAPVSSPPGASPGAHRRDVSPVVSALVAGSLATSSASSVMLVAMLDYDLAHRRYLIVQGGQDWVLLEPWRVRPTLALGFVFDVAGRREP